MTAIKKTDGVEMDTRGNFLSFDNFDLDKAYLKQVVAPFG